MIRNLLFGGALLIQSLLLCGCSANLNDTVYEQLAGADKGWSTLSDYDRGKRYLAIHDYGLAIDCFTAELQRDPASVRALNGLAIAFEKLGRSDIAERYFDRALALDANSAVTLNNLAYLRMAHGDTVAAAKLVARAHSVAAAAPPYVTTVVNGNEALLHQLQAPPSQPLSQPAQRLARVNDKEWVLHRPGNPIPNLALSPASGMAALADNQLPRIDIVNASGRSRLARHIGHFFAGQGFAVGRLFNAERFDRARSTLFFQRGTRPAAEALAASLPLRVGLVETNATGRTMQLYAGRDLDAFAEHLGTQNKKVAER